MRPFLPPDRIRRTIGMRRALYLLLASLATTAVVAADIDVSQPTLEGFDRSMLEIRTATGRHWLKIYLARTTEQQMQGLMFVRTLPSDQGMLFPLKAPRPMTMWMKNTLVPLDMLFIDAKKKIVCITANAEPQSLALINCDKPVKGVLEIAGGQAAMRGIGLGDTVVHASLSE